MFKQQSEKKWKRAQFLDWAWLGFVVGIIVPIIVYFVIYLTQYNHIDFGYFVQISMMKNTSVIILRTMAFANLPIFLLANILKKFSFCRGIFIATILILIPMLIINFL